MQKDTYNNADSSQNTNKNSSNLISKDIEKIKKERDDYLEGWKRAKADLMNYKKDEIKRIEKMVAFANEKIISDLLVVLDSLGLAIDSTEKVNKGIYLIKSQLEDILKKYGVEIIEVKNGDKFNPEIHEAVTTVEANNEGKPDMIVDEIETGYKLNGKVLRPSRVRVYK